MKKLLAMLLAMTMVVSLVACGTEPKETKPEETKGTVEAEDDKTEPAAPTDEDVMLRFVWWGNQVRTDRTNAALDLYEEQNPNVKIDRMAYQWTDYWTVNATSAAGDALPDIMQQDYAYIEQYVATDDLVDLTPYIESGAMDCSQIAQSVMDTGMVGDGVYAICAGVNAPSLVYNKTLTDKLGIEVPDNMTMDDFAKVSKEIYEKSGVKTNYAYGESENLPTYWVRSLGYDSFWKDGGLKMEAADDIVGWFEFCLKGVEEGWMMDPAVSAEGANAVETNALVYYTTPETQSWMVIAFSNMVEGYAAPAATNGDELAITCWPSNDPAASNYLKSSQFFSVTTDTKAEAEAVDVVNFMVNDIGANEITLAERGIPASANVADAIAPKLSKSQQDVITYLNEVVTPNCSTIFPPLPDGTSEVVKLIGELIESVLYKAKTPAEAAEELFTKGNDIMAGN